jgi:hypothetical protein
MFLPLNPVTIETITETRTAGNGTESWNLSGGCYRAQQIGPKWSLSSWLVTLPPYDEAILDTVVTGAIADSRAATWDVMTDMAEFNQTVRLIHNSWIDIHNYARLAAWHVNRYIRNLRKRRGGFKPKEGWSVYTLKLFSAKWLEYRYGWMPLLYSIEDAIKSLEKGWRKKGDIIAGHSKVVTDLSASVSDSQVFPGVGTIYRTHTLSGTRTYRGCAYSTVVAPEFMRFGSDPLVTGWELIPYSFVIDWFIDIGSWIRAVTPFSGARELGSMASVKDTYILEQQDHWTYSSGHVGSFTGRSTKLEVERYQRFAHSGGLLPSWNPRLNSVRVVDLLALVMQGHKEIMRILY